TEKDIPPCLIYIDKEGRWFHKGAEMIHREIIRHLYEHMEIDPRGRYIIDLRGDRCYVDVEDVPFIIRRTVLKVTDQAGNSRIILYLSDDGQEDLSPETLYVGNDNVIYCRVKGGAFPARFSRAAYYQLAEYIEEENERYYLPLNGKKYFIA
ncbi:hypothetical protein ACFL7M_16200, partial [Thermodesulfobacteriota bacterium]